MLQTPTTSERKLIEDSQDASSPKGSLHVSIPVANEEKSHISQPPAALPARAQSPPMHTTHSPQRAVAIGSPVEPSREGNRPTRVRQQRKIYDAGAGESVIPTAVPDDI